MLLFSQEDPSRGFIDSMLDFIAGAKANEVGIKMKSLWKQPSFYVLYTRDRLKFFHFQA